MKIIVLGCDGYLGISTAFYLASKGHNVVGVDNYYKRQCEAAVGVEPLLPIPPLPARIEAWIRAGGKPIRFEVFDLQNQRAVYDLFDREQPDAIVHYAEQPSAPYSMMGRSQAVETQVNNVVGTLNVLFGMQKHCPDAHLVKLGCYDAKTEILTSDGWKLFKHLLPSDLVATRTEDDRRLVFKKPKEIHEFDYAGKMYRVFNNRLDMLLTPEHRIFTAKRSNRKYGPLRLEFAEDIHGKRRSYDIGLEWEGTDPGSVEIPDVGAVDPLAFTRFMGWYLSEGSFADRKDRPNPTEICIPQKSGSSAHVLREDMIVFASQLGLEVKEYDDTGDMKRFKIHSVPLARYFKQFGKSRDKFVPRFMLGWSKETLAELLDTLVMGDGWEHHRGLRYYSISKRLADDVQEIALRCGWAATISDRGEGYLVGLSLSNYAHVNQGSVPNNDGWQEYNGKVHCVDVGDGHGIVLVRRNGKPVWSGNTMGEYGTPNIQIEEGWLDVSHKGRSDRMLYPKKPGSFYHCSKVHDSTNIEFACRVWGMRATDLNQGVVYGTVEGWPKGTHTSFHYDAIFGTALNRFIAQAVAGEPITVYGEGNQTRGFLNIRDTLRCVELACENPAERGEFRVFNQFTETFSVNMLARMVANRLPTVIEHIDNPRVEAENHYYEAENSGLLHLGLTPHLLDGKVLDEMIEMVSRHKDRITKSNLRPYVHWKHGDRMRAVA